MTPSTIEKCPHCAKTGDGYMCQAKFDGWTCTRPDKHTGDHSACGLLTHPYATWPQTPPLAPGSSL